MKATRRGVLAGALAVPAVAGLPQMAWARSGNAVLLHDPSLDAGRRMAATHGGEALAIEGDRIRFARAVFERRPSFVVGISRHADALLIEEVGREAGYEPVASGADPLREMIAGEKAHGWVLAPKS